MTENRTCPCCGSPPDGAVPHFEGNIDPSRLSGFSFASRKLPEYMGHRMLRCPACDVVYATRPPAEEVLAESYHAALYDSAEEAAAAARAYWLASRDLLDRLEGRNGALEIGTGTGVFLKYLADAGFSGLVGIEPSRAAIAAATPECRPWIREGMFDARDFEPGSFDLVCCFMTLEHVADPLGIARSVWSLLRPGGVFLTVTHDYRSPVNRLLGKRSPIVDIEHLQLFSEQAIRGLLGRAGFAEVRAGSFVNHYPLRYWARLSPLPRSIKSFVTGILGHPALSRIRLGIDVGNTLAGGFKPC